MLRTALLAIALLTAAQVRAAPACPNWDGPSGRRDLELARVVTSVDVVAGAAAVRTELTLRNSSEGPGTASLRLTTRHDDASGPPLVLQQARVVGGDKAIIERATVAAEKYEAFVNALENGVDPELVRGGRRVALHVHEESDGDLTVEVAAACSVRTLTIQLVGAILAEPTDDGERLVIPAVSDRDELRVTAAGATVWVDGRRPKNGVMVRRPAVARGEVDDEAVVPFVLDVRHDDARIRAVGGLVRVAPAPSPTTAADDAPPDEPSPLRAAGFSVLGATLSLPRPMSTTPPDLKLVFVIDASVSAGDDGVDRSLRLMQAILDAAPADAGWSLVAIGRSPRLVVDPWQPRDRRFLPAIPVENGSEVAAALELAVKIAGDAEAGAGRVVVLSDLQLKSGDDARLVRTLGTVTGPIVHVLRLPADVAGDDFFAFERVLPGDEPLASAVGTARGLLLNMVAADQLSDRELATHLIRPTRLDDLELIVDGHPVGKLDDAPALQVLGFGRRDEAGHTTLPGWLGEGGGLRVAATLPVSTSRVQLRGLVWADRITIDLEALPRSVGAVAVATATNGDLRHAFTATPDALEAVARSLGYVSAATSLVAVPTFRPARPDGLGMRGRGMSCCGCGGCRMHGVGHSWSGCGIGVARTYKAREILDALATEIADRCHAPVDATIEVGDLEVLNVEVTGPGRACVEARLWAARLDKLTPGDGSFEAFTSFRLNAPWTPPAGDGDDGDASDASR